MTPSPKGRSKRAASPKSRSGRTLSQAERRERGARTVASFSLPDSINVLITVLAARLGISRSEVIVRGVTVLFAELAGSGDRGVGPASIAAHAVGPKAKAPPPR